MFKNRSLVSWSLYDWATSSFFSIIQTYIFATYFVTRVAETKEQGFASWGVMMGITGIVVALGGPFLGAMADQGGYRKSLLALCSLLVTIATAALYGIIPQVSDALWALFLVGVATTAAESSYIFYNALLPEIAPAGMLGRWSGWGWAAGYVGGTLSLLLVWIFFIRHAGSDPEAWHVRLSFLFCAVWYALFALPLFFTTPSAVQSTTHWFKEALRQLVNSFRDLRKTSGLFHFFLARMLFTDGLITLFAFGGIYAAAQFSLTEEQILFFGIGLNVTAGLGAALFAFLDDRKGGKHVILFGLVGLFVTCLLALLAPSARLFIPLALLVGIFVGPVQASSRSYLARLMPPKMANEMFGFFALSSKATAFLGPLTLSWVTAWTGSLRLGMATILIYIAVGFLLMLSVQRDKA